MFSFSLQTFRTREFCSFWGSLFPTSLVSHLFLIWGSLFCSGFMGMLFLVFPQAKNCLWGKKNQKETSSLLSGETSPMGPGPRERFHKGGKTGSSWIRLYEQIVWYCDFFSHALLCLTLLSTRGAGKVVMEQFFNRKHDQTTAARSQDTLSNSHR